MDTRRHGAFRIWVKSKFMFFNKKIILETGMELEDVISKIGRVTSKRYEDSLKIKFEGEILNNEFLILPTENYSGNNRIRPEIHGVIVDNPEKGKREIHISFRLPPTIRTLFYLCLLNIPLSLCLFLFRARLPAEAKNAWWMILLALIIGAIAAIVTYRARIGESIDIFERLWKIK